MIEPGSECKEPHFVREYTEHTRRLLESSESRKGALQAAVGSATPEEYELVGRVEMRLLIYAGLQPDNSLVDIGCGSGRLAVQLARWLQGPYLGTDVVQSLLDEAAQSCNRPDWRFERVCGLTVPADSESVDMACAFSVFTHLRHEESYVYMRDIYRVLKPGARFVFSYLDYRVPELWRVLEGNIEAIGQEAVLNQFMSTDTIEVFAQHLGFELTEVRQGDVPFIPLTDRSRGLKRGTDARSFGQSVAIYRKSPERAS